MVALYDAATAAYHMIASTRPLPGLEVPLLPAPQNGNGWAQANSPQLPIATNAVHDTVPLKQRQAPLQAQPSAIMPSIPTQSTPAPQQQRQQPPPSPQIQDAGHQLPSRFSALSSSTKLAAGHKRRNSASTGDSTIPGCSSDESSKKTRLSAQPDLPVDAGHGSCVVNIEVGQRGPLSTFATSSSKASNTSGPVDQRRPCPTQSAVLSHDLLRQSQVKRPGSFLPLFLRPFFLLKSFSHRVQVSCRNGCGSARQGPSSSRNNKNSKKVNGGKKT